MNVRTCAKARSEMRSIPTDAWGDGYRACLSDAMSGSDDARAEWEASAVNALEGKNPEKLEALIEAAKHVVERADQQVEDGHHTVELNPGDVEVIRAALADMEQTDE